MNRQRIIYLIVLLLIGAIGTSYYFYSKKQSNLLVNNQDQYITPLAKDQPQSIKEENKKDEYIQISEIKDGKIFGYNFPNTNNQLVIGQYKDGNITITIDPKTKISFIGDINKVTTPFYYNAFSYDDIEITTELFYPYSQSKKELSISNYVEYNCNIRMFKPRAVTAVQKNESEPDNFYYCETNRNDYISQYFFTSLMPIRQLTGGGYNHGWSKVYSRKTKTKNIFFILNLSWIGSPWAMQDGKYIGTEITKEEYVKSDYLDNLLKNEKIKKKISEADDFVKNMKIIE